MQKILLKIVDKKNGNKKKIAKTKTAKVKDLRPEKITDKQLEKIQGIINNLNKIQLDIGMLETRKHGMLHGIAGMQDELTLMQQELEKDY